MKSNVAGEFWLGIEMRKKAELDLNLNVIIQKKKKHMELLKIGDSSNTSISGYRYKVMKIIHRLTTKNSICRM